MASARSTVSTAAPVVAAVTLFGIPYGVFASEAGFPLWLTVAMSLTVFAGSAQFTAVSVLGSGGSPISAAISGILLNTRYLATGTAVARVLPGGRLRRFLLAQLVVDESYALAVAAGSPTAPDARVMTRVGLALYVGWALGSLAGGAIGPLLGDPEKLGIDAAFPALFVALLFPLLDHPGAVRSALAGALTALALGTFTSGGVALAGAAVVGLLAHRADHE
jgi:4-azaleucine resistance transporter AzlC